MCVLCKFYSVTFVYELSSLKKILEGNNSQNPETVLKSYLRLLSGNLMDFKIPLSLFCFIFPHALIQSPIHLSIQRAENPAPCESRLHAWMPYLAAACAAMEMSGVN